MNRTLSGVVLFLLLLAILPLWAGEWVPLGNSEPASPDVKVLSSDDHSTVIEVQLPGFSSEPVMLDGKEYRTVNLAGFSTTMDEGLPQLPAMTYFIAVPAAGNIRVEVREEGARALTGYEPWPLQPTVAAENQVLPIIDRSFYSRDQVYPESQASLGETYIQRDVKFLPVTVTPIRYRTGTHELLASSRLVITLIYEGSRGYTPVKASKLESFHDMFCKIGLNYTFTPYYHQVPLSRPETGTGARLLIVCPDTYLSATDALMRWRNQSGLKTIRITPSTAGLSTWTTDVIKAYIQNAYDTWDIPPEYILLIGDSDNLTNGSPNWTIADNCTTYHSGNHTDIPYTLLAGGDNIQDAFIGRISADNLASAAYQIEKSMKFERDPLRSPDSLWFRRFEGVTRFDNDGQPSDTSYRHATAYVCSTLTNWGFVTVDSISNNSGGNAAWIQTRLNTGCVFAWSRGQMVQDWWPPFNGVVGAGLTNGWKTPMVFSFGCETGGFQFDDSHICETFTRFGSSADPKGCVTFIGAEEISANVKERSAMGRGVFHAMMRDTLFHIGQALTTGKAYMTAEWPSCHANSEYMEYVLLGDPYLPAWTKTPRQLAATHPSSINVGTATAFTVNVTSGANPLRNALVCVYQDTTNMWWAYTNATGAVTFNFTLATNDTVWVTGTAYNHLYYQSFIIPTIAGPFLTYESNTINDAAPGGNGSGTLERGETADLSVNLQNTGTEALSTVKILNTWDNSAYLLFYTTTDSLGNCASGANIASRNPFRITADPNAPVGTVVTVYLDISGVRMDSSPYRDTLFFTITIGGSGGGGSAQGPDGYGYYVYDDTDLGTGRAPSYSWADITTGTLLGTISNADDISQRVVLPFPFKFYGTTFTDSLTVSSNGVLIPGTSAWHGGGTEGAEQSIPNTAVPQNIIAPFWDDLDMRNAGGYGDAYAYFNPGNHTATIEYYQAGHYGASGTRETFEVTIYDPTYYPTPTGDAEIIVQYNTVGNLSNNSVGIENGSGTVGSQYLFNTTYDANAAVIQAGRAVKFTTWPPVQTPWLYVSASTTADPAPWGDADGRNERYERVRVGITVHNGSTANAASVSLKLRSPSPWVTLLDSTASIGAINGGADGTNTSDELWLNTDGVLSDTTLTFPVIITADGGYTTEGYIQIRFYGGVALTPDIAVNPTSYDFGNVDTNAARPSFWLHVSNTGTGALTGISMNLMHAIGPSFSPAATTLPNIPAGGQDSVRFTFSSVLVGTFTDSVRIVSNDPDENPIYVPLHAVGTRPATGPDIAVSPTSVDFGSVDTTAVRPGQLITVSNAGTGSITGITLALVHNTVFWISRATIPDLSAATSDTFRVTFPSRLVGTFTDSIRINSSDPDENPLYIPLLIQSVRPLMPDIALAPTAVDFGNVDTSAARPTQWLHVSNTGTANLTGITVSLRTGTAYQVSAATLANLAPGAMDSVRVTFTSRALGTFPDTVLFVSNDPDENPYKVPLTGTGIPTPTPDIAVVPTPVDFGSVDTVAARPSQWVYVMNEGSATLTGISLALQFGTRFTVSAVTLPNLAPGGIDSVRVTFSSYAAGAFDDTLRIASNDPDENPLVVPIHAVGMHSTVPDIDVAPLTIDFGSIDTSLARPSRYIVVSNQGSSTLSGIVLSLQSGAFYQISAETLANLPPGARDSFTVTFSSRAVGTFNDTVRIASNDPDENPVRVPVHAVGIRPSIPDIAVNPMSINFGNVDTNLVRPSQWIRVSNTGTAVLTGLTMSLQVGTAYSLNSTILPNIVAGGQDSFRVTFTSVAVGTFRDTVRIVSNDPDENPVRVPLQAVGIRPSSPDITVIPSSYNFGVVDTSAARPSFYLHIRNDGTTTLSVYSIFLASGLAYSVTGGPIGNLAPGASDSLLITFSSRDIGVMRDTVMIACNDPDEGSVNVPLMAEGVPTPAPNLSVTPLAISFGAIDTNAARPFVWVRVHNSGTASLTGIALSLMHNVQFSLSRASLPDLAPGAFDSAKVTFSSRDLGNFADSVRIVSNDPTYPIFYVPITGSGVISNIDVSPLVLNFGAVETTAARPVSWITISNLGTGQLTGISLSLLAGTAFSLSAGTLANLAPGRSDSFSVTFTSRALGSFADSVRVESNCPGESPIYVRVSASGVVPDIEVYPLVLDFGTVDTGATRPTRDVEIRNTGGAPLRNLLFSLVRGIHFSLSTNTMADLPAGTYRNLVVTYQSRVIGSFVDTLVIHSNDPDENPIRVPISGNGVETPVPDISVLSILDFGAVDTHATRPSLPLWIGNVGTISLTNVALNMRGGSAFTVLPVTLPDQAPGDSAQVTITFTSRAVGALTDTLDIYSNDPDENPAHVVIRGEGTATPAPAIWVHRIPVAFGEVDTLASRPSRTVTVSNIGTQTLHVTSLTWTHGGMFSIAPTSLDAIAPDGYRTLDFTLTSRALGELVDTLTLTCDDPFIPTVAVAVTATGVASGVPRITVSPLSYNYSDVDTANARPKFLLHVGNIGSALLGRVTLQMAHGTAFTLSATSLPDLAPGAFDSLLVTFYNRSLGAFADTIIVRSDDPVTPVLYVPLTARGTSAPAPRIVVEPVPLIFTTLTVEDPRPTRVLTITNSGTADLLSISVSFMHGTDFSLEPGMFVSIAPGVTESVLVHFNSTIVGLAQDTIIVISNDPYEGVVLVPVQALNTAGGSPRISIYPASYDFGEVDTALLRPHTTFRITNAGGTPLTSLTLTLASGDAYSLNRISLPDIASGASDTTVVTFSSRELGPHSDTLLIGSNDPLNPLLRISIRGTGIAPGTPALELDPIPVDFGIVDTSAVRPTEILRLHNAGAGSLSSIAIRLASGANFTATRYGTGDIASGGTDSVRITFTNRTIGTFSDSVIVTSNDPFQPRASVPVLAEGSASATPSILATPSPMDFGDVDTTSLRPRRILTIRNNGTAALTGITLAFDGTVYTVEPTTLPNLAPGARDSVSIVMDSRVLGDVVDTLRITSNDPDDNPLKVLTRARGTVPTTPAIDVTPTAVAFGNVDTSAVRPTMWLRVNNGGTGTLRSIRLSLVRGTAYSLGATTIANIAPGGRDSVLVTLSSRAIGAQLDTIRIASNDPVHSPWLVPASAMGVGGGRPVVQVTPRSRDFGAIDTTASRPSFYLRVANAGTANLTGIRLSLRLGTAYSLSRTMLADLTPGGRDSVQVTFFSIAVGNFLDTVVVLSNDPDSGTIRVPISATGTSSAMPVMTVAPTSVPFGEVETTAARPSTWVVVRNTGTAPLTSIRGSLARGTYFSSTPGTLPNLMPGGADSIRVTFSSLAVGDFSDTLSINSNDAVHSPTRVVITATGTRPIPYPDIVVDPTVLEFGGVDTAALRPSLYLHIGNVGTAVLSGITITFVHGGVFSLDRMSLPDIAVEGMDSVRVTLVARYTGLLTDSLRIQSSDPDEPVLMVPITAHGLPGIVPAIEVLPPSRLDFGSVDYRAARPDSIIVVRNVGTATLENIVLTIESDRGWFVLDHTVGSPLAPGASENFSVTFAARTLESFVSLLHIASNDPVNPDIQILLRGENINTGVIPFELTSGGDYLTLRPNPVAQELRLELRRSPAQSLDWSLHTLLGTEMDRGSFPAGSAAGSLMPIRVTDWAEGVYWLEATCGTEHWVKRVVVMRH